MKRVLFVLVGLALAACGGGGEDAAVDARAAIQGFGEAEGNVELAELNVAVALDPEGVREAGLELLGSEDPDVRFAAAYGLATAGIEAGDADALRPLLENEDEALRLLAAEALARAGIGDGVPVLVSLLSSDRPLGFSDGLQVWMVARRTLLEVTGEDLGLEAATDVEAAAATIPDWESWWTDAAGSFTPAPAEPAFG